MAVVEGERRFEAPPERVFDVLTDPDVIASAMPAMNGHSVIDADHWEGKEKPPLPLAPSIRIRFEVQERRPPEHAAMSARGGGADVRSTFDLAPDGDGTLMRWRCELKLTGMLARFAGNSLDAVAQRQAARTLDAVERAL